MTRLEELTANLADGLLTDPETRELEVLLAESDTVRGTHVRLLEIEAALRASRQDPDLVNSTMARLQQQVAEEVARNVVSEIRGQPMPEWGRKPQARQEARRCKPLRFSRQTRSRWRPAAIWLAAAACVIAVAGLAAWFFGPTMGEPVLAEVKGVGLVLERGGQFVPATPGTRLQSGDMLRTPDTVKAFIGFAPENTRVALLPGTELTLAEMSRGKRFSLRAGKLEVSAARQRPFQPMVLTTRQAQAQVVGTRFTLTVSSNSTRLDVAQGTIRFTRISDGKSVRTGAGHYAVAAADYELIALPFTGSILREWWTGVKGKTRSSLLQDPRFPDRPDKRDAASDFELTFAETNQLAVRLCGYVHPPLTGDYRFWLERPPEDFTKVGYANLLMSPTEDPSEAVQIAQTTAGGNLLSTYVAIGSTAAPPPIPLVAGKRYYIEARILIGRGQGDLSVFWQPPGQSRRVLSGEFLSPWNPK